MNKKTKIILTTNFILWILAMALIFIGAIFVFIIGKGHSTNSDKHLITIGEHGSSAVGGILIAVSVTMLAMSITFFSLKLYKESKQIVFISFATTLLFSVVMIIMSILDVAHIWSIWPWLINFGCLINFAFVLAAFKKTTEQKTLKSEAIKQIEYLNENGFLKIEEYNELKERAKRIIRNETRVIKVTNTQNEYHDSDKKSISQKDRNQETFDKLEKEQIRAAKLKVKEAKNTLKDKNYK